MKGDRSFVEEYYRKTGCVPSSTYPYFKLKHLLEQENLNLANTYICDQGSYNYYRLTGSYATSNTMASGSGLYNLNTDGYDQEILKELSIECQQLPLVEAGNKLINERLSLSNEAKEYLGIENDVEVTVANPDGAMNQLGSSGRATGSMTLSVGTSGAIRVYAKRPLLSEAMRTWCYKMDEGWLAGGATSGACSYVDDEKEKLFAGAKTYENLEKDLLDLHNEIILNKESFMKQCYYMPFNYGERSPGWNMYRSGGYRLDIEASGVERYRSALEGVLFNLYQCYEELVAMGQIPRKIRLSGGILHSNYWVQMCADIFGQTITIDPQIQTSLVGGVEFAMNSINKTILEEELSLEKVVVPNHQLHELYKHRYEKYLCLYDSND
jgi:gluconokinase